eukprot:609029-Rhodomonas_salina.2
MSAPSPTRDPSACKRHRTLSTSTHGNKELHCSWLGFGCWQLTANITVEPVALEEEERKKRGNRGLIEVLRLCGVTAAEG